MIGRQITCAAKERVVHRDVGIVNNSCPPVAVRMQGAVTIGGWGTHPRAMRKTQRANGVDNMPLVGADSGTLFAC